MLETQLDSKSSQILDTAFLDTGGAVDYAALNMCSVDVLNRKIYIRDTMFWKLSKADNVTFASIRNDIAILHKQFNFHFIGCETNNYGRSEMESMRRDYGIRMYGVNTVGKITSDDIIKKGESMDKNSIIKFTNSWRQNADTDPANNMKLGQIVLPVEKSEYMVKWMNQLDSFVRKDPEGIGATGNPKFGAEGTGHDDGVMASLGNIFLIKTKLFKLFTGTSAVGAVSRNDDTIDVMNQFKPTHPKLENRAMGSIRTDEFYEGL